MPKILKIAGFLCTVLLILSGFTALFLPKLLDANHYKQHLITWIKQNTGRDLAITGDLRLSISPWLTVTAEGVSLSNPANFPGSPLATLNKVQVRIEWSPLMNNQLVIHQIALDDLALNPIVNAAGKNNWADLRTTDTRQTKPLIAGFSANNIQIKNARIHWLNQQSQQDITIDAIHLDANVLALENTFPVTFSCQLNQSGKTLAVKGRSLFYLQSGFTAIRMLKPFVQMESSALKTLPVQLNAEEILFDLSKQQIKSTGAQIDWAGIQASLDFQGEYSNQKPDAYGHLHIKPFNLAEKLNIFNITVPPLVDPKALHYATIHTTWRFTNDLLTLQRVNIQLDDSVLTGHVTLKNLAHPQTTFNLSIDQIDGNRYTQAKTDKKTKDPTPPALALAQLIPIAWLRDLPVNGELTVKNMMMNSVKLQDLQLRLQSDNPVEKTGKP